MAAPVYEHVARERRWPSVVVFAAMVPFFLLFRLIDMSWSAFGLLALAVLVASVSFQYFNYHQRLRITLDDQTLKVWTRGFEGVWPLDEIEAAQITGRGDDPGSCRLELGGGRTVLLSEEAMPPADDLAAALTARRVTVRRS